MADLTEAKPRRNRGILWTLIKVSLALLLIGIVLSRTNLSQLVALLQRISWAWLAAFVILFLLMTLIKTWQYHIFFGKTVTFPHLLTMVILQNALMNFVTTGAGIASLLTMLKVERQVKLSHSSVAFLLTKVGDFFALWCFLVVSALLIRQSIAPLRSLVIAVLAILGAGLLILFLALGLRRKFMDLLRKVMGWTRLGRLNVVQKGMDALEEAVTREELTSPQVLWKVGLVSMTYLAATMAWMVASLRMFHVQIGVLEVVFVNVFIQLLSNIPVQVFGGLGVNEASSLYLYGFFLPSLGELTAALIGFRLLLYALNLLILLYLPIHAAASRLKVH